MSSPPSNVDNMTAQATPDTTATSGVSPSKSNVPDLLRVGTIPDNTAIDIETDILDPVVFNQSFCRIQLQPKGILHSNSKITLSASITSGSDTRCYYPPHIGVHSLIDRAVLKVGNKTLCEVEDFGHFMAYQSMFISGEHNKEREQYTTGRMMNHMPFYQNGSKTGVTAGSQNASLIGQQNASALAKGLQSNVDLDQFTGGTEFNNVDEPYGNVAVQGFQTLGYNPTFQVNLSDLFPFLKTSQLPLYMMNEPVSLELFWTPSSGKNRFAVEGSAAYNYTAEIVQTRVQMVADYIFYPQELMTQYRNQNQNLQFAYVDYRLAKRTVTSSSARNLILNIGGAGRICNKVIQMLSLDATGGDDSPFCNYESLTPARSYTLEDTTSYNGSLTFNLRYNDHFLFPVDVDNTARHFHNIVQTEGKVPFITRQEYSGEGDVLGGEFENHPQSTALTGKFFYLANRLNRNERVNSRGVEAYVDYNTLGGGNHTIRFYIELVRMAQLTNGSVEIQYA
jgi:hypothetical protein